MSLLVTGSIGVDTVQTPFGVSENCIGGSAVYFSLAAEYFSQVRFVGVIGDDCPFDLPKLFDGRKVDLRGLEKRSLSKTFRWKGSYFNTMNEAITDNVELNVLAERPPVVPEVFTDSKYVFLANTAPALQAQLLSQIEEPEFVAADTMNCWIQGHTSDLHDLLKKVDALILNDAEARMLVEESNLVIAAKKILDLGPSVVIIKKGESGSITFTRNGEMFILPAYPASEIKDPTGAGDSFAGGFMGYLASAKNTDFDTLKKAIAFGTVVASFTISDFSVAGLAAANMLAIEKRLDTLRKLTGF